MKMRVIRIFDNTMIALLVLLSQAALGQTPAAPKSKASAPNIPKSKATSTQRPTTDDIESVVRQLVALGPGIKGEFETTAQFEARVQKTSQPDKQYTFSYCAGLNPSSSGVPFGVCDYAYDADKETMTVYMDMEERHFRPDYNSLPAIRIKNVTRRTEHHVGTNSFGARVQFTSRFDDDFGVVLSQASVSWLVSLSRSSPDPAFSFPLSIETVRGIKASLRLVLIGTVPGILVYRDDSFDAATVSFPFEVTIKRFYLQFSVIEVRIIDSRTANVLATFHPDKR
jgi:hypothetical protein